MTRVRGLSIAVALTAALLVSACSGSSDDTGSPRTAAPSAAAVQSVPALSAAPAPAALTAARAASDGYGDDFALAPVTLNRRGNLLLLELNVTVTKAKNENENANLSLLFVDGELDWQVSLVDPVHGKRYLPASDSKGDCLCTNFTGGLTVEQGQSGLLSAWFAAPPADVKSVDIEMPKLPTFTAVPISG